MAILCVDSYSTLVPFITKGLRNTLRAFSGFLYKEKGIFNIGKYFFIALEEDEFQPEKKRKAILIVFHTIVYAVILSKYEIHLI